MEKVRKCADLLNRNWFLKTVLSFLPSIWLPLLVKYIGTYIGVVNSDQNLTAFGWILTIILYGLSLFTLLTSGYWASKDKESQADFEAKKKSIENTRDFYHQILSCLNVCNRNQNKAIIDRISAVDNLERLYEIPPVSPNIRLSNLAQEIRNCFNKLTAIPPDKLIVTMAYSFNEEQWEWVDPHEAKNGLALDELVTNTKTTFYEVLHSSSTFVYHSSKQEANADGHYVFDDFDFSHRNVGSIVCWRVPVILNDRRKLATLVVSISSYGYCFDKSKADIESVKSSVNFIFDIFEEFLEAELISIKLSQNPPQEVKDTSSYSDNIQESAVK